MDHSPKCRIEAGKGRQVSDRRPFLFVLPCRNPAAPLTGGVAPIMAWPMDETRSPDTLARLEATIAARRTADPAVSYVARLNQRGLAKIAQKLGEEGVETVIAALSGERQDIVGEAADLLFHLMVLLDHKDIPLHDVLAELDRREGVSGLVEKASRGK